MQVVGRAEGRVLLNLELSNGYRDRKGYERKETGMQIRAWLLVGILGIVGALRGGADVAPGTDEKLVDYRGKGEVVVRLDQPGADPISLTLQMEQVFRKPGTLLLSLNLLGAGLNQTFLSEANVEQSYNPVQGVIVEKRFKNLEKSPTNPLLAFQASMYDFGRKVRGAKTRRGHGTEMLLGHQCDVVEVDSSEVFQDVASSGLLGGSTGKELRNGRTKAWLMREYGLPVRIELFASDPKPVMSVAFTELKINAGVGTGDLQINAPAGTRRVVVTCDLADPEWEKKMDEELKKLLAPPAASKQPGVK
jgi:hypothetical protein